MTATDTNTASKEVSAKETIALGKFKPSYKPKYMTSPELDFKFEFDLQGAEPVVRFLKEFVKSSAATKMLAKQVKTRLDQIDKALKGVDADIDKKFKNFFKEQGFTQKSKNITPQQMKAYDAFKAEIEKLVKNLQAYLQQICAGIEKSDSMKWIEEVLNAGYDKIKKAMKGRDVKRASGGRARIVILAIVAVAVGALAIAGTVMTGGLLAVVILGVVGASIGIIATVGKAAVSLSKTKGKLQSSVAKLEAEGKSVEELLKKVDKAVASFKEADKKFLKELDIDPKVYEKTIGKAKPDVKKLYPILNGRKRLFFQFDKHLKDVDALAAAMAVQVKELENNAWQLEQKLADMVKQAKAAKEVGPGEVEKFMNMHSSVATELGTLKQKIDSSKEDLNKLLTMVADARAMKDKFDDYGFMKSKVSGWRVKASQVNTFFSDVDTLGKSVGSIGKGVGDIDKALKK